MLQVFLAPADLSQWIDGAVLMRMGAGQQVSHFPAMPRAMLTLHLVRLNGQAWSVAQPAMFHTLTTEPTTYTHAGEILALGLIIRPSAAACLLGRLCGAITGQSVSWGCVAGESEAARLADELDHLCVEMDGLRALTASFSRVMDLVNVDRWQQLEHLCATLGHHGAKSADILGVGRRQLERRCLAVLGMTPKQFERLERFHRVLSAVLMRDAAPLVQAALDAGYYDQSHLALDARLLSGATVGELKLLARPDTSWWALSTQRAMHGSMNRSIP